MHKCENKQFKGVKKMKDQPINVKCGDVEVSNLTLRDYFAAAALTGMMAHECMEVSAKTAYEYADDMIEYRK
jgi:hypothetical protein